MVFRSFSGRLRMSCATAPLLAVMLLPATCITVSTAAAQSATQLPPVTVEKAKPATAAKPKAKAKTKASATAAEPAQRPAPPVSAAAADVTATEGSKSYSSDYTSVGGKVPTQFKESTQSVSVVTQQRLLDQNLNTVDEAVAQTTGVTVNPTGSGFSQVLMRGYFLDTIQVDGMPYLLSTSLLSNAADLSIYDHVEVLRGADGMFQGAGYPGGVVNLVRKHALDRPQLLTSTSADSWGTYRGMIDITGPLNQAGTVRGRFVTTYQDRGYFYDEAEEQKGLIYGTLEVDLNRSTTISVGATKQDATSTPFFGLPAYNNGTHPDLPRSTFVGADWNRDKQSMTDLFVELEHRFINGGHIKISGRDIDRSRDAKYAYTSAAANPATNLVSLARTASQYDVEQSDADVHLYSPFTLFGLKHSVLIGADYKRYYSDFASGNGTAVTQNIFALNPHIVEPTIALTSRTGVLTEQEGIYGQLRLQPVNGVTVVLGDRFTNWENTTENLVTHKTTLNYSVDNRQTPYAGLIVDLTQQIAAYGSYTDIFSPQGSMQSNGQGMPPRVGTQYETGLKGKFLDGKLNTSAAVFYVRDTGRALADPLHPGYFLPAGLSESKGFEAEISGTLAPGWQVYGGYAYTVTEYLEAAAADKGGSMLPMLPQHSVNLWTTYNFQNEALRRFTVGGGIKAVTDFYRKMGTVQYNGDGYIVANAMVSYKVNDNISLSLNVNNLFDTVYFQNVGPNQNFYGEPRSVMLRLDGKF